MVRAGRGGTHDVGSGHGGTGHGGTGHGGTGHVSAVLAAVETVPAGQALSYGDVAELCGSGAARSVGMVMARWGDEVAWWRVVRVDGTLPEPLLRRALPHWQAEGTPLRADGRGVDMARARWRG